VHVVEAIQALETAMSNVRFKIIEIVAKIEGWEPNQASANRNNCQAWVLSI